jgi:hypothetical protein
MIARKRQLPVVVETNDRDLLDLPAATKNPLPFAVVWPSEFLRRCEL